MDVCRCSDPDSVQLKPAVHKRDCGLKPESTLSTGDKLPNLLVIVKEKRGKQEETGFMTCTLWRKFG
ncbi:unnamed protein product [Chondrus crispus]|uniref:Uncharacterized protein n=1 Tax=Chondrus crispus TaxID=2769 RepID=R7Q454_CHOCR|nr:unnamed protein product [Chondrus crispus]CDF32255.1 unnamed protein product [Chondrus crispus]|eukprot:XP_005711920.1 unnamed protein product [Chondrus crispus]